MNRTLALLALAVLSPATVQAKDDPASSGHIQVEKRDAGATLYQADQYYVRLVAGIGDVQFGNDKKKNKKLFEAFLTALGGRKESREVSVRLLVNSGGVALPEYQLATYRLTEGGQIVLGDVAQRSFPRMRLRGGDKITVNVIFRDAQAVEYSLGELSKNVVALLPGGSLVSDIAKPQFKQVADVTSKLFSAVGSHDVKHDHEEEMGLAANDSKLITLRLRNAKGDNFGLVTLQLMATPTLPRDEISVFGLDPAKDFKRQGEDLSDYEFELAGVKRTYLSEVRALAQHADMLKLRTDASVKNYCTEARGVLGARHGLTMMDRTYLMLQSLHDADFEDDAPSWYHACFNDAEKTSLKLANGSEPGPVVQGKPLDYGQLYAFGCLVRATTGQNCEAEAPNPPESLGAAMQDKVALNIDSSFLDTTAWEDGSGMAAKAELLGRLKATATNFGCIGNGSVLVKSPSAKVYRLTGRRSGADDRIGVLTIRNVNESEWDCTHGR